MKLYLGFFDFLEVDLVQVVEESRAFRKVLGDLKSTFIALIPKKDRATSLDEYRPISLCNTVQKVIVKILANRVKKFLTGYICPEQFAFLKRRHIHEQITIAQEVLHMTKVWRQVDSHQINQRRHPCELVHLVYGTCQHPSETKDYFQKHL